MIIDTIYKFYNKEDFIIEPKNRDNYYKILENINIENDILFLGSGYYFYNGNVFVEFRCGPSGGLLIDINGKIIDGFVRHMYGEKHLFENKTIYQHLIDLGYKVNV